MRAYDQIYCFNGKVEICILSIFIRAACCVWEYELGLTSAAVVNVVPAAGKWSAGLQVGRFIVIGNWRRADCVPMREVTIVLGWGAQAPQHFQISPLSSNLHRNCVQYDILLIFYLVYLIFNKCNFFFSRSSVTSEDLCKIANFRIIQGRRQKETGRTCRSPPRNLKICKE